jgi:long-chain acyl-CoA synthetase
MNAARARVVDRLRRLTGEWGTEQAIEFEDRWLTWDELGRTADALERLLAEHATPATGALTLVMRQRPSMVIAELAALRAGRTAVLLTPLQTDSSLASDVIGSRPAVVVLHPRDWERPGVVEAVESAGALGIELGDDLHPAVRTSGGEASDTGQTDGAAHTAVTVQTSGTTGRPKRLPVSWQTFVQLGGGEQPGPDRPAVSGRGALILAVPLVTLGGLLSISRLVFGGRPLAMMERFDVHAWARLVKRHRPKVMGAPPPVVKMILDADVTPDHFDGVTAFMTSSAAIAPEVIVEFERRYRIPVLLGYGATEFLNSVTGWTPELWATFGAAKVGSVGRALPGVQLRVVDGVLEVDPPQRAGGLPTGWLRTSDRARIDDDGFVWILGRTDDVIVRGGFKVDLGDVERAARAHPGVEQACAVGVPDERLGEVPALLVTAAAGVTDELEPDRLRLWLRQRLPAYCVPVVVRVVDAIPLTITFKPDRHAARAMLTR